MYVFYQELDRIECLCVYVMLRSWICLRWFFTFYHGTSLSIKPPFGICFSFSKHLIANPRDEIKPNAPCGAMGCHWYWFHASINIKTMGPFRTAEWLDGFLQKHPKHVELSAPRQPTLQGGFGGFLGGQILRMIHQISRWVFPKIGLPPNHPLKHRVFHNFHHAFWGFYPYFWKHPGGVYMLAKFFIPLGASSNLTEAAGPQDSRLGRPQWFAKAWPTQSWQPGRCRWRSWYSGRFGCII